MPHDLAKLKKIILKSLQQVRGIAAVYVYGSYASGQTTDESDLDIGILFQKNAIPAPKDLFDLQINLTEAAEVAVDLVCLNMVSPILGMQVLKKGVKILDSNPHITHEYIIRLVNDYDDLKRVRKPIEEQILKGRIYG